MKDLIKRNAIRNNDGGSDPEQEIINRIKEIKTRFSKDACLAIVGSPENIPDSMQKQYNPTDLDEVAFGNMDHHYQMFKRGLVDPDVLINGLRELLIELDREFTELTYMFLYGKDITL